MNILDKHIEEVKELYQDKKMSMSAIARNFDVSLDTIVSIMRKNKIPRRTHAEANKLLFESKTPSFKAKKLGQEFDELKSIGAMLYWAEGYKTAKSHGVDFANSDSNMIKVFLKFLRACFELDEKKFRIYLYCYKNQDPKKLVSYWSRLTNVPSKQFFKPYVREDFRTNGRKMEYGLIHVRYYDKKLLKVLLDLIEYFKEKYAPVV